MSYEDACETIFSRARVIREIKDHHLDPRAFFAEVGDRKEYKGRTVLNWLGY